jgi:hypothetical protein
VEKNLNTGNGNLMETHEEPVTSYRSSLELDGSLLIRGIQIGEMSKLGWLIGLVKHVI